MVCATAPALLLVTAGASIGADMSRRRFVLPLLLLAVAVAGGLAVVLGAGEDEAAATRVEAMSPEVSDGLAPAQQTLSRLQKLLEDAGASPDDVLDALARLHLAYLYPPPPPGSPASDARGGLEDDGRRPVGEGDLDAYAHARGWPEAYLADVRQFRRSVERLLLRCVGRMRTDGPRKRDAWQAVYVRAAEFLGDTGNPDLTRDMIRVLDRLVLRPPQGVPQRFWDAALAAVARLGRPAGLEWMKDEFVHTASTPQVRVDQMSAAHKAMLLFDRQRVPGELRYELVKWVIMIYAGVEALARQDSDDDSVVACRAFWKRIGPGAIRVAQHFSFDPSDGYGRPLDTIETLAEWFRHHRDPLGPPWADD